MGAKVTGGGNGMGMVKARARLLAAVMLAGTMLAAQTAYQPKFKGDPARSASEAGALGYMRTVLRAQRQYKQKYSHYATSLMALVHTGSFTRRMVGTDRGDYTVSFRLRKDATDPKNKDAFELALTPKQLDTEHRSFYAQEDGMIHAEETKAADEDSPLVK